MLLIIEKQPVQYRAPLYATIEKQNPGLLNVLYESQGAITATLDKEFGGEFAWDVPLLEGYSFTILESKNCFERCSLFLQELISDRYDAILLTGFDSWISRWAFILALLTGKPIWIRMETQDQAFKRGILKDFARSIGYRVIYSTIQKALFIGQLNKEHYRKHGFQKRQLRRVPYIVSNPIGRLNTASKQLRREQIRMSLGIPTEIRIVSFFGKLIPKKQPDLLLQAHQHLSPSDQKRVHYLFVGSGTLEAELKSRAQAIGCNASFTGFINQSKIHDYYLACDIMCLPSRQMGETWGLTVNEGLQAGCSIICSEHVGSSVEFQTWERIRVCRSEDPVMFASLLHELMDFQPDFDWCKSRMEAEYSMTSAAKDYISAIKRWGAATSSPIKTV